MVRTPPRTKRNYTTLSLHDALPISSPTPGDAITACFGADPSNPAAGASGTAACTQIQRDPLTGGLNGDPNTTPGLFLTTSNLGRLETSGIDVALNYSHDVGFAHLDRKRTRLNSSP